MSCGGIRQEVQQYDYPGGKAWIIQDHEGHFPFPSALGEPMEFRTEAEAEAVLAVIEEVGVQVAEAQGWPAEMGNECVEDTFFSLLTAMIEAVRSST